MYAKTSTISEYDQALSEAMAQEAIRQEDHIELIASENYASPRVLEAQGSVLTNKYAEGYPGKRYYGGCEYVDVVEQLALTVLKRYSVLLTLTFNRMPDLKQTRQHISR